MLGRRPGLVALVLVGAALAACAAGLGGGEPSAGARAPIDHIVVLFLENRSFDHLFGTYPGATGLAGYRGRQADQNGAAYPTLPAALVPSEPEQPDTAYEKSETKDRIRVAIESLPAREQKVIGLYYYQEATMKQIGAEIGVNESRVSQLHARAIRRLRDALAGSMPAAEVAKAMRTAILEFQQKPRMAKAALDSVPASALASAGTPAVVVDYASVSRTARSRSESLNGLASQRQPLSSRKRSASVPATSPVTKITRRASSGVAAAMAR